MVQPTRLCVIKYVFHFETKEYTMQLTRYLPQGTLTYPVSYSKHHASVSQLEEGDVLTVKKKPTPAQVPDPPPMTAVTSLYFGEDTLFAGLVYSGQRKVSPLSHQAIAGMKPSMPTPIVMGIGNWLNKGNAVRAFDLLIPGPLLLDSIPAWQRGHSDTKVTLYATSPMLWREDRELRAIAADPDLRALFINENTTVMCWSMVPTWYMYLVNGRDTGAIEDLFQGKPHRTERQKEMAWLPTATLEQVQAVYHRMWRQVDCKALTDAAPGVYCKNLVRQ